MSCSWNGARSLGGACVTEELFPKYRFSTCSYICHLLQAKVIDDLELRRYGFEVYHLDPFRFQPFPDGRRLLLWDSVRTDPSKKLPNFRRPTPSAIPNGSISGSVPPVSSIATF